MVTAFHVMGSRGVAGDLPASFVVDGKAASPMVRLRSPRSDDWATRWSYARLLFEPAVPRRQARNVREILPEHDFLLYAVSGLSLETSRFGTQGGPIELPLIPPTIEDPLGVTTKSWGHADIVEGERILLAGFPRSVRKVSVVAGEVLDATSARRALLALRRAHDVEGRIAYRPAVEAIIRAEATTGMSGSGAFDRYGRLVGVAVRASDRPSGSPLNIVRVVRISHILRVVRAALARQPLARQQQVALWLPPPVAPPRPLPRRP